MATNYKARPRKNESPELFIKRFIKKCKKLGIIDEVKDRKHHTKPSVKKRMSKKRAIARHKKELRKQLKSNN